MGQTVTLTAEPADGYHFAGWEVVSGEVALDGDSFAMPAGDVTVRAVFEPHAYGAYEPNQDGTHTRVCAVCGERQTEACSGGTATCATLATCALCGHPYGELAEHEPEVVGAKDATCTEDGYTGDAGAFFSLPLALLGSLVAGAGLALRRRRS